MLADFRKFALRGNVIDLAVGVILGVAFGVVVQTLVDGVLMNLIAAAVGEPNFGGLTLGVGDATIFYGSFLTAVVNFVLIAFALFVIVRIINRATGLWGKGEEPATVRDCPFCKTSIPAAATRCSACTSKVEAVAA